MLHRSTLVHCNAHLKVIDGITITEDERVKARLFHTESPQQVTQPIISAVLCKICSPFLNVFIVTLKLEVFFGKSGDKKLA